MKTIYGNHQNNVLYNRANNQKMPPKKQVNSKQQYKPELAEKVKEIKQRQQNWFKQREEQNNEPAVQPSRSDRSIDTKYGRVENKYSSDNTHNSVKQAASYPKVQKQYDSSNTRASGHGDGYSVSSHKSHTKTKGFNAWMKAREKPSDSDDTNENTQRSTLGAPYVISKEKTYSVPKKINENAESHSQNLPGAVEVNENAYDSTIAPPSLASGSLSADDFDQLADQIVNRVKNELDMTNKPYYATNYTSRNQKTYTTHRDNNNHTLQHTNRSSSGLQEKSSSGSSSPDKPGSSMSMSSVTGSQQDQSYLEGHYCPQCEQLMVGKHDPMLIIPCGHNICKSCSEIEDLDLCTVCSCEVSSFTSNIMLKQIIVDHKRNRHRMDNSRKKRDTGGRETREIQAVEKDYKEEIKTLMIRLDVLESESDNIKEAMDGITREIKVEHKQVANIERQEERVRVEIEELNVKLDDLNNHKQDYFDKVERLQEKHKIQEDKLQMVKDTIRQLNRDVENIQLSTRA